MSVYPRSLSEVLLDTSIFGAQTISSTKPVGFWRSHPILFTRYHATSATIWTHSLVLETVSCIGASWHLQITSVLLGRLMASNQLQNRRSSSALSITESIALLAS